MTLSVVIPLLNDAAALARLLDDLARQPVDEIIVVDGGSVDDPHRVIAAHPNVRLVRAPCGRGQQIRFGAHVASGELLWILHADSRVPMGAAKAVREALSDPKTDYGSFRLAFAGQAHPLLRLSAVATRMDSVLTTFGDQGLFCRQTDYRAVGGAPDWPLFEDVALRQRLKRRVRKGRGVKLSLAITTSARRFVALGPVRCQLLNLLLLAAYGLGVSPHRLAAVYRWTGRGGAKVARPAKGSSTAVRAN